MGLPESARASLRRTATWWVGIFIGCWSAISFAQDEADEINDYTDAFLSGVLETLYPLIVIVILVEVAFVGMHVVIRIFRMTRKTGI